MNLFNVIKLHFLIVLIWTPSLFADFCTPQDNPPFRRDQLPIDIDIMSQLSRQISTIGSSVAQTSPENERLVAQCVAVAVALDPVNRHASALCESFENKKPTTKPDAKQIASSISYSWRTYSWLIEDESGKDANVLANCLGDILAKMDPQHPSAEGLQEEKGAWVRWVSPLSDFTGNENQQLALEKVETKEPQVEPIAEINEQPLEDPKEAKFVLQKPSVMSPFWLHDQNRKSYKLSLCQVTLVYETKEEADDFRYWMPGLADERTLGLREKLHQTTKNFFVKKFGKYPVGGRASLRVSQNEFYSMKRNQENLSAAAAVLTHACFSGQESTGIVVGAIDGRGKLVTVYNIWELVSYLESAPSSRIVLPKSVEQLMPSLITMDHLSFFMKHDLFFADDIEQLIRYSLKSPDATIAEALKQFHEIRVKSTTSLGSFIANPHVLKRLEAIQQNCPQLASVRFLIAAAKMPRGSQIDKTAVAHEIRKATRVFDEIGELEEWNLYSADPILIQNSYESMRKNLDSLERFVSSQDKPLYERAVSLANQLRTLSRAVKLLKSREDFDNSFHEKSARSAIRDIKAELPSLEKDIGRIIGHNMKLDD